MKRLTKEERLAKEELTKTQVLNLSELEKVANYEKTTSKKPAIFLAVLGIICITMGTTYNGVTAALSGGATDIKHKEIDTTSNVKPVSTINCQYNALNGQEGYDTYVNMTLIFNNSKLKSYTKVMNVSPSMGKEEQAGPTVTNLYNNYKNFETLTIPGYDIVSRQKDNGFETIVAIRLEELDRSLLNIYHDSNVVTKVEFTAEDTKETVMKKAKTLQYICE